jgi:hypothetical protein
VALHAHAEIQELQEESEVLLEESLHVHDEHDVPLVFVDFRGSEELLHVHDEHGVPLVFVDFLGVQDLLHVHDEHGVPLVFVDFLGVQDLLHVHDEHDVPQPAPLSQLLFAVAHQGELLPAIVVDDEHEVFLLQTFDFRRVLRLPLLRQLAEIAIVYHKLYYLSRT